MTVLSTSNAALSSLILTVIGSSCLEVPREPEKGANVFGLSQTQHDLLRAFAQVGGSPFDSRRLCQTHSKRRNFPDKEEVRGSSPRSPTTKEAGHSLLVTVSQAE